MNTTANKKATDTLSRDREPSYFESLSEGAKKLLKRAASLNGRKGVDLTEEVAAEIDRDWLMVPSKKGQRQVVVNKTTMRCYAI